MHYLFAMRGIALRFHFIFWSVLIVLSVAMLSPYYYNLFKAVMHRVVFIPVWLIATYVNLYFLLPRFWDQGRKWAYVTLLTLLILLLTVLQRLLCIVFIYPKLFWMRPPNADEMNPFWIGPFVQFAMFILLPVLLSIGLRAAWKWFQESENAKQLVAEQQRAELSYLKAQVNPHFLFNTLNNLYGLSLESSKKVPAMILQLSDLLSYSLYESKVDKVELGKEVKLIQDFISLESERYEGRIKIKMEIAEDVDLERRVAPLLLLPLIENAFKHGVRHSTHEIPIRIKMSQAGGLFKFYIENEISKPSAQKGQGGLGLKNLRRRLELAYPGRHLLEIDESKGIFVVTLEIRIDG